MEEREALIEALVDAKAIKIAEHRARAGAIDIDLGAIFSHPDLLHRVSAALRSAAAGATAIDLVCPATQASFPMVMCFSLLHRVPMVTRRNEGIDGSFAAGQSCLLIHDVLDSVDPVMETVEALAAAGIKVLDMVALIDREKGGGEVILKHGLRFHSAITWGSVRAVLEKHENLANDLVTPKKERVDTENLPKAAVSVSCKIDAAGFEELKIKTPENKHDPGKLFPKDEDIKREHNNGSDASMEASSSTPPGKSSFASESMEPHEAKPLVVNKVNDNPTASVKLEDDFAGLVKSVLCPMKKTETGESANPDFPKTPQTIPGGRSGATCAHEDSDDEVTIVYVKRNTDTDLDSEDPHRFAIQISDDDDEEDLGQLQKRKLPSSFSAEDSQASKLAAAKRRIHEAGQRKEELAQEDTKPFSPQQTQTTAGVKDAETRKRKCSDAADTSTADSMQKLHRGTTSAVGEKRTKCAGATPISVDDDEDRGVEVAGSPKKFSAADGQPATKSSGTRIGTGATAAPSITARGSQAAAAARPGSDGGTSVHSAGGTRNKASPNTSQGSQAAGSAGKPKPPTAAGSSGTPGAANAKPSSVGGKVKGAQTGLAALLKLVKRKKRKLGSHLGKTVQSVSAGEPCKNSSSANTSAAQETPSQSAAKPNIRTCSQTAEKSSGAKSGSQENQKKGGANKSGLTSFRLGKRSRIRLPSLSSDGEGPLHGTQKIEPANQTVKVEPVQGISTMADELDVAASQPAEDHPEMRDVLQDMANLAVAEETVDDGLMTVELLKHQKLALAWMIQSENREECPGGFLADDQGLGKTVSMISLILKAPPPLPDSETNDFEDVEPEVNPEVKPEVKPEADVKPDVKPIRKGGTLVVCPASVLRQWTREIESKVAAAANLSTMVYHGSKRMKCPDELVKYDVVLTTYQIVKMEVPGPENWKVFFQPVDDKSVAKKRDRAGPLAKVSWFRVVLDEAQAIKNAKGHIAKACCGLKAEKRWCLSGTPIQNAVNDLFGYFRFLRFAPLDDYGEFKAKVKSPITKDRVKGYEKLQKILQVIMLRRTKDTVIDGEPILRLPPKHISLQNVEFTKAEREFYDAIEKSAREQFQEMRELGAVKENFIFILILILRMRQACCHRFLVPKMEKLDLGGSLCTICADVPEHPIRSTTCGHVFCAQCISDEILTTESSTKCPSPGCNTQLDKSVLSVEGAPLLETPCGASSKIKAILERLKNLPVLDPAAAEGTKPITEKAIVFSQWTALLNLLEPHLEEAGFNFRRLDGTMSVAVRDAAVRDFNENPEISVMLMSLKAGGLGLNMIAASHVFLMDIWWNPSVEDQAIDRAHRIGQTRPVHVSRLTVKNTIEDRILALQEKKKELASSAYGDGKIRGANELSFKDLSFLFGNNR